MYDLIKKNMLKNELNLSEYACLNKDAIRLRKINSDIRGEFYRDIDKIIYSLSYTRYSDKTQVFSLKDNDNISRRMTHVQMVSKIARTISRALNLNEDLTEAIALGHDIGHVPFGHTGESILNEISLKYDNTYFMHNVESVRELMYLENGGNGLNLTIQVIDGILCHNGEIVNAIYKPRVKTKEEVIDEYERCYIDKNVSLKIVPMTLEGCVVRISDVISYLRKDIEDAIRLNLLDKNTIPKEIERVLGKTNGEFIDLVISDIIKNSYGKNYIKMSKEVYDSIELLKKFNYENIYLKANSKEDLLYYKKVFNEVFVYYLENIDDVNNNINKIFLSEMNDEYLKNTSNERKVIDYIAGMTDDFIIKEHNKIKSLIK